MPQAPDHTPENAASFFAQAEDNLLRKNWDAAGAMFRKVLENSLKERFSDATGSLYQIIKKAGENHKLTPDMTKWEAHIRLEGNKAVHDKPFSEKDAYALREFTFLILMYLFALPGMLQKALEDST